MTGPDAAATFARNLCSALAALGVRHAVLSPGSRNGPLALAAAAEPELHTTVVLDERSAGFVALGLAKSTRDPVVTICTSGTAAAHYHPAVAEAFHARVPLLVVTADRPPELRGSGAPQTIEQANLFGSAAKLFHDSGVPDDAVAATAHLLAQRLFATAADGPAGPVHLNVPLREPLLGSPRGEIAAVPTYTPAVAELQPEGLQRLSRRLSGRRAIVVAGGRQRSGFGAAAALFGVTTGIPVLADVQCRQPGPTVVTAPGLLAAAGFLERDRPDLVVRLGGLPTSKPLWRWLETSGVEQVWIDDGPWRNPLGSGADVYRADPTAALSKLAATAIAAPEEWTRWWIDAGAAADEAAATAIAAEDFPSEPAVARIVAEAAPIDGVVYAGSSMPVRDLDSFAGPPRPLQVLANRGANGIDGLISAAAGAAIGGRRAIALSGDVAAIHDLNALVTISRHQLPVTAVIVNNDGGGIFHFLDHADPAVVDPIVFEQVFGTPHGVSLVPVASALGIAAEQVTSPDHLRRFVADPAPLPRLVEVMTDRRDNVEVHRRIAEAVSDRLR